MNNARDVEKRWRDPAALRQAVEYGIGVIVVAGVAFAVFAVVDKRSVLLAAAVPAVLFLGGVGALFKAYVRDNLARYKVPREVVFLEELPRNPTGKILKRELREMAVGGDDEKAEVE